MGEENLVEWEISTRAVRWQDGLVFRTGTTLANGATKSATATRVHD